MRRPQLPAPGEDATEYYLQLEYFFEEELPPDFQLARKWIEINCNAYEKMPAVMWLHNQINFGDWVKLLGHFWTGCDNIGMHADELLWILTESHDAPETIIPELMDEEERSVYDSLPDEFTIYRGCRPLNKRGFSWSLDRDAAAWFPFSARCSTDSPTLLTATVRKSRVAAVKLRGTEQEVIVVGLSPSTWIGEPLTEAPCRRRVSSGHAL